MPRHENEFQRAIQNQDLDKLIQLSKTTYKSNFYQQVSAKGNTIFHVIARKGTPAQIDDLAKHITHKRLILSRKNKKGNSPLHIAAKKGRISVLKKLMAANVLLASQNQDGDTPLHLASRKGFLKTVQALCSAGLRHNHQRRNSLLPYWLQNTSYFNFKAKNKLNQTPYGVAQKHHAFAVMTHLERLGLKEYYNEAKNHILKNKSNRLESLLKKHAELKESLDEEGNGLVHHAALAYKEHGLACLRVLKNNGLDMNAVNNHGQTPFLLLATIGLTDNAAQDFTALGAKLNVLDHKGMSALHYAGFHNDEKAIDKLVPKGLYVDHIDRHGMTPMHAAALCNQKDAFAALYDNMGDINRAAFPSLMPELFHFEQPGIQITSLWLALQSGSEGVLKSIVDIHMATQKVRDITTTNIEGFNLCHFFASTGDVEYLDKSIRCGVTFHAKDKQGYSAVHVAAQSGHLSILKFLFKNQDKVNIREKTFAGKTPYQLAKANNHRKVAQFLQDKGGRHFAIAPLKKGIVAKAVDFAFKQDAFATELQARPVYQLANLGRILWSTLSTFSNPLGMPFQFLNQAAHYSIPILDKIGAQAYYTIKPYAHNYGHWLVEGSLDAVASLTSTTKTTVLTTIRYTDYALYPAKYSVGYLTALALSNLAAKFTDNKDVQALLHFAGRELGMAAVDAYQNFKPKKDDELFDYDLNKATRMWTLLLGDEVGTMFVNSMHAFILLQQSVYESVGKFEHAVVDTMRAQLPELSSFKEALKSGEDLLNGRYTYFLNPVAVLHCAQNIQTKIAHRREALLQEIEDYIGEHVLPESEFKRYTLAYTSEMRTALLEHKRTEAHAKKEALTQQLQDSEPEVKKNLHKQLTELEQTLTEIQSDLEQSKQKTEEYWLATPKGAAENDFNAAQDAYLLAQMEEQYAKDELDFLHRTASDDAQRQEAQSRFEGCGQKSIVTKAQLRDRERAWQKTLTAHEKRAYLEKEPERIKDREQFLKDFAQNTQKRFVDFEGLFNQQVQLGELQFNLKRLSQDCEQINEACINFKKVVDSLNAPGPFIAEQAVKTAFQLYYNDPHNAAMSIIRAIAATGVISVKEATDRMYASFVSAVQGNHRHQNLTARVTEQWRALFTDYKQSIIKTYNNLSRDQRQALKAYGDALANFQHRESEFSTSKQQFAVGLAEADKQQFENDFKLKVPIATQHNWQVEEKGHDIRKTLILTGQCELAFANVQFINHVYSPHLMSQFMRKDIARLLIDYKYLFLPAPKLDKRLKEAEQMAASLSQSAFTPSSMTAAIKELNKGIAQNMYDTAYAVALSQQENPSLFVSAKIVDDLSRGFTYQTDTVAPLLYQTQPLGDYLAQAITNGKEDLAIGAIAEVLESHSQAISVKEVGMYAKPKAASPSAQLIPTPEAKQKKHGLKKVIGSIGDALGSLGKTILANGVTLQADMTGVFAGLNQNMFKIYSYHEQPTALFKLLSALEQKTIERIEKPTTENSKKKPIPSVPKNTTSTKPSRSTLTRIDSADSLPSHFLRRDMQQYIPEVVSPKASRLYEVGTAILDWFISPAGASPIAIAQLGMTGSEMGAFQQQTQKDLDRIYSFPLIEEMVDRYNGTYPDDTGLLDRPVGKTLAELGLAPIKTTFPIHVADTLFMFRKKVEADNERKFRPDPDKQYVPAPKNLQGFPDAVRITGKTPYPGGIRTRWQNPDGTILEWDRQHGEIELYDKRGKHLGAFDAKTGEKLKDANKTRTIKKYL